MSMLDAALAWAARGFRVFPLAAGTKDKPLVSHTREASTDPEWIRAWWQDPVTGQSRDHNVGVSTTGMVVIDVDVRNQKPGLVTFLSLVGLINTLTVRTPSGGLHCYYTGPDSAGLQGKYGLGEGLDIRSHGNYVVGPGSYTAAGPKTVEGYYTVEIDQQPVPVPEAIKARLKPPLTRENASSFMLDETPGLVGRAISFLQSAQAPPAVEGQHGDDTTYRIACRLRDLGVTEHGALGLLLTHWNDRCNPPWSPEELAVKVENAYNYATGFAGSMSPETHFADLNIPDQPPPPPTVKPGIFTFGNAVDPADIPPRPWVLTRLLMRGQVSVLIGPGGAGKSLASLSIAAHLAMGLPFLDYKPKYGAAKSIVYDEEDDVAEMSRRLWAICHAFRFSFDDVRNRIILLSRRELGLRVTIGDPPQINVEHVTALGQAAAAPDVGLVVAGPLVSLHSVSEDDNVKMAFIMGIWRELAEAANVAILLGHHVSKPSGTHSRAGDAYAARGAGAIVNSARFAHTLYTPTADECEQFGIRAEDRFDYARFDDAKMNHARQSGRANWFRRASVELVNGDDVGVLQPHDMDKVVADIRAEWARIIIGEMRGKATASVSLNDAANMLKAGDPLLAKLPAATLRSRVMTALAGGASYDGTHVKIVKEHQGNKFVTLVVLH